MFDANIKSLFDLQKAFPNEQKCIEYLEYLIWNGNPVSPFSPQGKIYKCKDNKYKCKDTGKYFNIKTNSCFEGTKLPLQKWLYALWVLTNSKKGISSVQLASDIGVTQKSAWFLLGRIRKCFGVENGHDLEGEIECDETFYGGKNINRHKDKKVEKCQGRSFKDKVPILGMIERNKTETITRPHKVIVGKTVKEKIILKQGKLNAIVIPDTKKDSLQPLVRQFVIEGSRLLSDEWMGYKGLNKDYQHNIIDHSKKEYVNLDDSTMHTNNIEGMWKILKAAIKGTYNSVSRKHLQIYCDEWAYRTNTRYETNHYRMDWLIVNSGVRTRYKDLIL